MPKILFASNNSGKLREATAILSAYGLDIVSPQGLGLSLDVEETGETYLENALLKAKAFHELSGLPVIADDSGLEVELLNGAPGIHSHRFAGLGEKSDQERCLYLISQLAPFAKPWLAAFHCEAVFFDGDQTLSAHGLCRGEIISELKGSQGFGYDPVFRLEGQNLTMAEAGPELKNRVGHRANALRNLVPELKQVLKA